MATFNPGDLVQISEHQYSSARRNSLEFPIHGNFKPGARVWHSISNEDTGIILELRPEDAVWLVLFGDAIVEITTGEGRWLQMLPGSIGAGKEIKTVLHAEDRCATINAALKGFGAEEIRGSVVFLTALEVAVWCAMSEETGYILDVYTTARAAWEATR